MAGDPPLAISTKVSTSRILTSPSTAWPTVPLPRLAGGTGGIAVTVDHGGGLVTWYLHNSQVLVSVGQHVSAGQQISVSGSTGFSTGPHLHFQINRCSNGVTGTAVNPAAYFGW